MSHTTQKVVLVLKTGLVYILIDLFVKATIILYLI